MLIPPKDSDIELTDSLAEEQLALRASQSLALLKKFQDKAEKTRIEVSYEEFIAERPEHTELLKQIEKCSRTIEEARQELASIKEKQAAYLPWKDLNIRLDQLDVAKTVVLRTGLIPDAQLEALVEWIESTGNPVQVLGASDRQHALVYAVIKDEAAEIDHHVKMMGFTEVELPKTEQTPEAILAGFHARSVALNDTIQASEARLRDFAKEEAKLRLLYDRVVSDAHLKQVKTQDTLATVFLEGWVRSDRIDRVKKAIEAVTDLYDMEQIEPDPGEQPPTVTKNNWFVDAFETITDMFEKPHPDEVDPNPVMSIWYWLIFGIMMGDAGYGIVMVGLFAFLIAKMKPKGNSLRLFRVLMYSGVSTIIWGILFGSYFGVTWNPILMSPMDKPLEMLILSIVIGGCHIISGLLVKAYRNFRDKQYFAIIADQFSWIFILIGAGLFFLPATKTAGMWLMIAGAGLILLFSGERTRISSPVSAPDSIRFTASPVIWETSLLLSHFGADDVLGHDRHGYEHAGGNAARQCDRIHLLAFVYLIGHAFNLAMGMLSAYIHDSRLQYIEFLTSFTKAGASFQPLSLQTYYVDMVNDTVK